MKPKLVTVTGHRTNTLYHQLKHYKDIVSDIFVVVYENAESQKYLKEEIEEITKEFGIEIHSVKSHRPFDWQEVTRLYNKTKMLFPNDWWIIADDDELQIYSDKVENIIKDCEENGYEFITGGFVDRIGIDGEFLPITKETDIFEQFPMAGFFRWPLSGACPNKVTLAKGKIEVTNGQHYAKILGEDTWRWRGWNHPLRYPVEKNFTQVHHFKWDKTVLQRLQDVAKVGQVYAYSEEYKQMYEAIKSNNFKIDIYDERFMFQKLDDKNYFSYTNWNKLSKLIQSI